MKTKKTKELTVRELVKEMVQDEVQRQLSQMDLVSEDKLKQEIECCFQEQFDEAISNCSVEIRS